MNDGIDNMYKYGYSAINFFRMNPYDVQTQTADQYYFMTYPQLPSGKNLWSELKFESPDTHL